MRNAGIFMGQQPLVLSDCRIKLTHNDSVAKYPNELRMITARVLADGVPREMSFITNNLNWSPYSICDLYCSRWGIEVFFKEIKQTLQLADFLGTSENAIKWQIWSALLAYLLLRLTAWLHEWKHSFRRLYTLVKGMLWSRRNLAEVIKLIMTSEIGKSPPTWHFAEQLCFDFGDV